MSKRRILAPLALALGMGVGVAAQAAPAFADSYSPGDASAFVAGINALRASHGLGALAVNSSLIGMADNWAVHLAGVGSLSHNPGLASQAPGGWRLLGENVGVGPTVAALQAAFTASPEHYANMVDPRFSEIGVGVYVSSQGYMWVTEDYMEPPAAAAPVATAPRASTPPAPSTVSVRPVALTTPAPAPVAPAPPVVHAAPVPAPVHPAPVAAPPAATPAPAPVPATPLLAKPVATPPQIHRPAAPTARPAPKVSSGGLGALIPAVSRYASHSRDTALLLLVPLGGLAWLLPRRRTSLAPRGRIGAF